MILPDVNVLVYALHGDSPFHDHARKWLETALVGQESIAIWDVTFASAYRVLTNPRMGPAWSDPQTVLAGLAGIRMAPACVPISTGERFWDVFSSVSVEAQVRGALASDAMIAALAIEHGCRLATFDQDFSRFKALNWFKPTA